MAPIGKQSSSQNRIIAIGLTIVLPVVATLVLAVVALTYADVLGDAFVKRGNVDAAITCYQVMTSTCTGLGLDSKRLGSAWTDLAICYAAKKRIDEAIAAQIKGIAVRERVFGKDHTDVLIGRSNLANFYATSGNLERSGSAVDAAILQAEAKPGGDPVALAYLVSMKGMLHLAQHDEAKAEECFKQCIEYDDAGMRARHESVDSRDKLAALAAHHGDLQQADQYFIEAVEAKKKILGPDHIQTGQSLENLGKLQALRGYTDQARDSLSKCEAIYQKVFGANDPRLTQAKKNHELWLSCAGQMQADRQAEMTRQAQQALEMGSSSQSSSDSFPPSSSDEITGDRPPASDE